MKEPKRSIKEEYKYDEQLCKEESIKTEVIVELRNENRKLLENQERILIALIQTGDLLVQSIEAIKVYRNQSLSYTRAALQNQSSCVPGCDIHYWDSETGWNKKIYESK